MRSRLQLRSLAAEEPCVRVAGLIRGCFGWLPLDTGLPLTPHLKFDQTCSEHL